MYESCRTVSGAPIRSLPQQHLCERSDFATCRTTEQCGEKSELEHHRIRLLLVIVNLLSAKISLDVCRIMFENVR